MNFYHEKNIMLKRLYFLGLFLICGNLLAAKDLIITDFVAGDGKTDVSDAIQRVIDTNPNRTIYFPDGTYLIGKPLVTPADPARSVSLKLADFAVIKAAANWRSPEAMIRLGGMIHDLECYVDNYLKIDENGKVVGRNRGIRGWLRDNMPELSPKYKTLMRYKALAVRLRQATETKDPEPTSKLLKKPYHEAVKTILADEKPIFSHVFAALEYMLAPETVMLDAPKVRKEQRKGGKRRCKARRRAET